jgi:hypothetical protein
MGQVVNFIRRKEPEAKAIIGYRMSFYSEEELEIALVALNMFGWEQIRYTKSNLKGIDPLFIKRCLLRLKHLDWISRDGRRLIDNIISNVEEIYQEKAG